MTCRKTSSIWRTPRLWTATPTWTTACIKHITTTLRYATCTSTSLQSEKDIVSYRLPSCSYIFSIHFVEVSFWHVFFLTIPLSIRIFADTFIDCISIYRWCRLVFSPFLPEILSSPTRWSSHLKWWMWETDNRMILHDTRLPRLLHNLVCIACYL